MHTAFGRCQAGGTFPRRSCSCHPCSQLITRWSGGHTYNTVCAPNGHASPRSRVAASTKRASSHPAPQHYLYLSVCNGGRAEAPSPRRYSRPASHRRPSKDQTCVKVILERERNYLGTWERARWDWVLPPPIPPFPPETERKRRNEMRSWRFCCSGQVCVGWSRRWVK